MSLLPYPTNFSGNFAVFLPYGGKIASEDSSNLLI